MFSFMHYYFDAMPKNLLLLLRFYKPKTYYWQYLTHCKKNLLQTHWLDLVPFSELLNTTSDISNIFIGVGNLLFAARVFSKPGNRVVLATYKKNYNNNLSPSPSLSPLPPLPSQVKLCTWNSWVFGLPMWTAGTSFMSRRRLVAMSSREQRAKVSASVNPASATSSLNWSLSLLTGSYICQ